MTFSTLAFDEAARVIHQNYQNERGWEEATYTEKLWARGTLRAALDKLYPELYDQELALAAQTG